MSPRQTLLQRFRQWHYRQQYQYWRGINAFIQDAHVCWMPRGNLYTEHDIGNKLVRYPDGKRRAVRVTKVRDTGGATWLSFAADTPLNLTE